MSILKKNIIVTGIPRSGTTLTAALLDHLSNTICLSEPKWHMDWLKKTKQKDVNKFVEKVVQDYSVIRYKVEHKQPIKDRRTHQGQPVTNYYQRDTTGKARKGFKVKATQFKVRNHHFTLGIKHNGPYTSILPKLINRDDFSIICVVRHPVPTIMSWRSLNLPISKAKMPDGSKFWRKADKVVRSKDSLLLKQVKIYDLYCSRYLKYHDKVCLLKYEDLIQDPSILENITGRRYERKIKTKNQNKNGHYDHKRAKKIKNMLKKHAPHAQKLYNIDDY